MRRKPTEPQTPARIETAEFLPDEHRRRGPSPATVVGLAALAVAIAATVPFLAFDDADSGSSPAPVAATTQAAGSPADPYAAAGPERSTDARDERSAADAHLRPDSAGTLATRADESANAPSTARAETDSMTPPAPIRLPTLPAAPPSGDSRTDPGAPGVDALAGASRSAVAGTETAAANDSGPIGQVRDRPTQSATAVAPAPAVPMASATRTLDLVPQPAARAPGVEIPPDPSNFRQPPTAAPAPTAAAAPTSAASAASAESPAVATRPLEEQPDIAAACERRQRDEGGRAYVRCLARRLAEARQPAEPVVATPRRTPSTRPTSTAGSAERQPARGDRPALAVPYPHGPG